MHSTGTRGWYVIYQTHSRFLRRRGWRARLTVVPVLKVAQFKCTSLEYAVVLLSGLLVFIGVVETNSVEVEYPGG